MGWGWILWRWRWRRERKGVELTRMRVGERMEEKQYEDGGSDAEKDVDLESLVEE